MQRTAYKNLLEWKSKTDRKPLLVTGVRQCGKTYLISEFGQREYDDMAYFNFDGDDGIASIFDYDLDTERIIRELSSIVLGRDIRSEGTLVVFDEIQACPRAIQSLKYFCENMPDLHIIAAGSLLGVALRSGGISFPVGKVDRLEMFPMSFEEFVEADGGGKYISGVREMSIGRELPQIYTVPLEKYLKDYYIIGGMPEAVAKWTDTHNYKESEVVLDRILLDYADDFGKYAARDTAIKIRLIWDSIPSQIARDNNKFIFSRVKKGARSKDLEDALEWLISAGIAGKLRLVSTPQLPLRGMADDTFFKMYMSDIGLMRRKSNINYRTILDGDHSFINYKGALTENYVYTQLRYMGMESYFWRTKSDAEVDFVTNYEGVLLPIEVKSADNTKAKSLHQFCCRYHPPMAVKTSLKNVGDNMDDQTHIWSIPLYMLFRIKDYISSEMGWDS